MTGPTPQDLSFWADADDLVEALGRVEANQRDELQRLVETLLDHEDPDVREEALRILCVLWKVPDVHARAVDALLHDPEAEVRGAASYAVAATSSSRTHGADVRALLEVLQNENQPAYVRGAAYDGLLIVHQRAKFPTMKREFRPREDVDWDWVQAIATEAGK